MKRIILPLLIAALLILCCSCQIVIPALPAQSTQSTAATAAPSTEAPSTAAPKTEAPSTEPPQTAPATTEAPPVVTTTEAPPVVTTTEAPPVVTTTEAPGPEADPYYTKTGDVFTNSVLEFRLEDGDILCKDLASGKEEVLFSPEQPAGTTLSLIGVTDKRLYFGWNEEDDWWGLDVYSVDHKGKDRQELGQYWDPEFEGGWLFLMGFRSDVSPTELRIIDRNDKIIFDDSRGSVWSGMMFGESFYFTFIKDLPESWEEQYAMTDVTYQVLRLDPDNSINQLSSFHFDSFYHPAFISDDGTVNFYSEDGDGFSYNLFS